ncbi:DUF2807 domain-containing protein [Aquimarina sp. U1-2]|uniref:head GIN domain-containing protein n=1 Tax=Aquimarina sp. U1-2 TaxID=2823141 RepID=UPI001AEC787C|nr:head GIN domain-containing protein [Aquimarina sp. U1-2]MBP2834217.1 DUF2807 domain-containing protein [Aquimarina sp. U1-2]
MQKFLCFIVFLTSLCTQSQEVITRKVGNFNELKVFDKIQVVLIQSDKNEVEITGNKRNEVEIVQNNKLLKVRMSLDNLWDGDNTKVVVYYSELRKVDANEGAKVKVKDILKAPSLDIRVQEGATIVAKIEADHLYGKMVTGGIVELFGSVDNQDIVINSGGEYYAKDLKTTNTKVTVSAGGTAEVQAKNYLKANTNAGGTIRIFGKPRELDTQKLLGGKIIEVN